MTRENMSGLRMTMFFSSNIDLIDEWMLILLLNLLVDDM